MAKKKKQAIELFKIGAVSTIGASALSGYGGVVGTNVMSGIGAFSTSFPTLGSIAGAGLTINELNKLRKLTKRLR